MNGLEISRAYFDECGMPMLEEKFPELLPHVAAGLFGSGSECFGFDDELSRDHDFDPGFMLCCLTKTSLIANKNLRLNVPTRPCPKSSWESSGP